MFSKIKAKFEFMLKKLKSAVGSTEAKSEKTAGKDQHRKTDRNDRKKS